MKTKFKNPIKKACFYIFSLTVMSILNSCKKQDAFLNEKPLASLSTISSLSDCQLLLQNTYTFGEDTDPGLGEISSDDFYVPDAGFIGLSPVEQNCLEWGKTIFTASDPTSGSGPDYSYGYTQVYYANSVLDALPSIPVATSQQALANNIKGTALFFRAYAFYNLVQTFAMPYDSTSAATQLGIPLRLTSDLNVKSVRASEKECYNQILADLQIAANLLPATQPYLTLPSQTAAYGLLARVYLAIGNYNNALKFANLCLVKNSQLVDYNTITPASPYQLLSRGSYFSEDIYHCTLIGYSSTSPNYLSVTSPSLYNLYSTNDLRKSVCFVLNGGLPYWRGTYDYMGYAFSGLATDEIYLIRAECYARAGNITSAMNDLNTLLVTRWKTGTFVPFTAASTDEALNQILVERRKELLYRGLRWTDLRRLNKDPKFAITLVRVINGVTYTLPPNDPRYALPLPEQEIQLAGIPQNQR